MHGWGLSVAYPNGSINHNQITTEFNGPDPHKIKKSSRKSWLKCWNLKILAKSWNLEWNLEISNEILKSCEKSRNLSQNPEISKSRTLFGGVLDPLANSNSVKVVVRLYHDLLSKHLWPLNSISRRNTPCIHKLVNLTTLTYIEFEHARLRQHMA